MIAGEPLRRGRDSWSHPALFRNCNGKIRYLLPIDRRRAFCPN
jgi:hypothetical protein